MKITLYGRDVDGDVWQWARERAERDRVSLSRVVVDALRAIRETESGGVRPEVADASQK
jgi:hypothetical protein